jgi:hypothetical protein
MPRVRITVSDGAGAILAPLGCATPHLTPVAFNVSGAPWRITGDTATGQLAALIEADGMFDVFYEFAPGHAKYPEAMFVPTDSRYTRAADGLVEDAKTVAADAGGGRNGLFAVVQDVAQRFTYGHVDETYYADEPHVPQLCDMTVGSCVDINLYLIAALRAAGYEAGYMTGYFFPEEKGGTTTDMHCWVVSRFEGETLEWDIAHHMKLGVSEIAPGLNPKPGRRVPMAHSMGLQFPEFALHDLKLIGEPVSVKDGTWAPCQLGILYEDWTA